MTHSSDYDVIVVGGGIVGLTLTAYLGQAGVRVALIERSTPHFSFPDIRVSAINRATEQVFKNLNAWPSMETMGIAPYEGVLVWGEGGNRKLFFDSAKLGEKNLGTVIENGVMQKALWDRVQNLSTVDCFYDAICTELKRQTDFCKLCLQEGITLTSPIAVGADGARSWVRSQLSKDEDEWGWDYGQKAIVATVRTELPHGSIARQRFLKSGPLAFLPLKDPHLCSIVWTHPSAQADELMSASPEDFCRSLQNAFENRLGSLERVGEPLSFPLVLRHARRYIEDRVAWVGDAIHTIHPLAGLGLNLGIRDAMCVGDVLLEAQKKKRDMGSYAVLRRYERARKGANIGTSAFVEGAKWFFGEIPPIFAQQLGFLVCEQLPFLKNFFARKALYL